MPPLFSRFICIVLILFFFSRIIGGQSNDQEEPCTPSEISGKIYTLLNAVNRAIDCENREVPGGTQVFLDVSLPDSLILNLSELGRQLTKERYYFEHKEYAGIEIVPPQDPMILKLWYHKKIIPDQHPMTELANALALGKVGLVTTIMGHKNTKENRLQKLRYIYEKLSNYLTLTKAPITSQQPGVLPSHNSP